MSIFSTVVGGLKIFDTLRNGNDSKSKSNTNAKIDTSATGSESLAEILNSLTSTDTQNNQTTFEGQQRSDASSQTSTESRTAQDNLTQAAQSTGTEATKQATTGFAARQMEELNELLSNLIGPNNGLTASSEALKSRLASVTGAAPFDVDSFVDGIMSQATSRAKGELESGINQTVSNLGGSTEGNSMSALLANRMRNDTAANLAGIEAQARATGVGTRSTESAEIGGLAAGASQNVLSLIQALSGAQTEATGTTQSQLAQNTTQQNTSNAQVSGQQSTAGTSNVSGYSDTKQSIESTEKMNSTGTSAGESNSAQSQRSDVRENGTASGGGQSRLGKILDLIQNSAANA